MTHTARENASMLDHRSARSPADAAELSEPFGVYIHWPYCAAKCPYCDFNSHIRRSIDHDGFADAIGRELATLRELTGPRQATTLFFGGGTPSLMKPLTLKKILDRINILWPLTANAEITLEANPTSVEAARFSAYRELGINRVSVGVQALNDNDLKFLGRNHNVVEARRAVEIALAAFPRVSFDLIYGRPGQTVDAWRGELTEALALPVEHLSLYQLTIEPGTPFAQAYQRGRFRLPSSPLARALYDATAEICGKFGLAQYEVSNYARPNAQSKHNLIYWRGQDYAGAGPGAHSRIPIAGRRHAVENDRLPEKWMKAMADAPRRGLAVTPLSREETGDEYLLMGLRLIEGIDLTRYEKLSGRKIDNDQISSLVTGGLIERVSPDRIAATRNGFAVLDRLIAELAA